MGIVESERLDGITQVEASEKNVEEAKANIDEEKKEVNEEIAKKIMSFQKFEKDYWRKEEPLHSQL